MTHPESLTTGVEERLLDTKQAGDMTKSMNHSFGSTVRRERERLEIGLRQMAKMISVSPTYLSKVERDEFPPPAEDKVKAIAKIIGHNTDEILALAGRVALATSLTSSSGIRSRWLLSSVRRKTS